MTKMMALPLAQGWPLARFQTFAPQPFSPSDGKYAQYHTAALPIYLTMLGNYCTGDLLFPVTC